MAHIVGKIAVTSGAARDSVSNVTTSDCDVMIRLKKERKVVAGSTMFVQLISLALLLFPCTAFAERAAHHLQR